jgi:hypothetical protein
MRKRLGRKTHEEISLGKGPTSYSQAANTRFSLTVAATSEVLLMEINIAMRLWLPLAKTKFLTPVKAPSGSNSYGFRAADSVRLCP